jgi:hypothetical protein
MLMQLSTSSSGSTAEMIIAACWLYEYGQQTCLEPGVGASRRCRQVMCSTKCVRK